MLQPQATADSDEGRLYVANTFLSNFQKEETSCQALQNLQFYSTANNLLFNAQSKFENKVSTFTCNKHEDIAMCISPCFELFHMQIHYCKAALVFRIANEV